MVATIKRVTHRPHAFSGASLRALLDRDLTLAQLVALLHVDGHPGARVGEIALALGRSVPASGRLLEDLVRDGLLTRQEHASDRRVRAFDTTPEARRLLKGVGAPKI